MSHWVCSPIVSYLKTGAVLLDLGDSTWHLDTVKESERAVDLTLIEYTGAGSSVVIHISAEPPKYQFNGKIMNLSELVESLRKC